jgi:ABC-2 type transport system ATP-binding protein
MKRRLDLAMALVHSPAILFLDEPSTGLDPDSRSAVWAEVRRLARDLGATVLLTTHYLEEADTLADRVGIVDRGRLIAEGAPERLKREMGRPLVEIVPASVADTPRVVLAVQALGTVTANEHDRVVLRLREGTDSLEPVNAVLAREKVAVSGLALRPPSLEEVFLARTGRSFEVDPAAATDAPLR